MATEERSDDNALLSALRHPLRRRILRLMEAEEPISPRQISTRLEHPLSNVSYHVRVLARCSAIALVFTEPVRGSMQHFYRASLDAPWARQMLELEDGEGPPPGERPAA
ncbi:MAG: helix-turn-helix domain-containing protein [Solirubrobacterales bacterium]